MRVPAYIFFVLKVNLRDAYGLVLNHFWCNVTNQHFATATMLSSICIAVNVVAFKKIQRSSHALLFVVKRRGTHRAQTFI